MDNQTSQANWCCGQGGRSLMGPTVLVTLGVLFLLSEFHVASFSRTWPILLIVIGLMRVLFGRSSTAIDETAPPPPPAPGAAPSAGSQNPESRQVENV